MDNQPRIVTVGEALDMIERKRINEKKYRLKVSYGSLNKEDDYKFNIQQAILDKNKQK